MSNKHGRKKNRQRDTRPRISRVFVGVTLALMCIAGTSMLAQVNSRKKARNPSSEARNGSGETRSISDDARNVTGERSVMNFTSGSPAKEYVYAGSKLVATEEPIAFADPGIASNPYYSDILKIARRKVTLGCGVNAQGQPLFCPNDPVTRDQMAAFIMRALGEFSPPTPPSQRFNDVAPLNCSQPCSPNGFYNFIDRMAVLNITLGCDSVPNYCPGTTVLHEQMATFIVRALHVPGPYTPPPPSSQRFPDVPASNPFYRFIEEYAARGIWRGCNDVPGGNFCPQNPVTRAQMAHILVQAFGANWQ